MSVDFGRWKFVIIPSIALNSYPGKIKILVQPEEATNFPLCSVAIVSRVRVEVVPTEIMRPPFRVRCLVKPRFLHSLDKTLRAYRALLSRQR